MKKCSVVMTANLVCCLPSDSVIKAAQLMKAKDIGAVLVVDGERTRKLVGIVTDRDLAVAIVAEGRDATLTRVDEVMTRGLVTCRADHDLQRALDAMSVHQLRRIPILDEDGRLVGIISQADVATRVDLPEKTAEMVKEISQATTLVLER